MTKYRTIVADPPWDYERDHVRWFPTDDYYSRSALATRSRVPYAALSVEKIITLPVARLAEHDCRLFIWATNRFLPDGFQILEAWGFKFRQVLVWRKTNPPPYGGSLAPNCAEFLLVATRGSPQVKSRWPESVVTARLPRHEHSRKPEVFLDLVETVSPGPYLELFARRNRLGWDYRWHDGDLAPVPGTPSEGKTS